MNRLAPAIFSAVALFAGTAAAAPKPNIVIVLIDDMGWADFSSFGNPNARTPNIDRLAKEGIRFEDFYVNAPICSPSRTALLTGQYPQRWGINSYLDNRKANAARGVANWLDPKAPSLARFLQQAGYATGHFGKWHMGGQRDVGEAPLITAYGFDKSLTNFEGLGPRVLPLIDMHDGKPPKKYALGSDKLGHGPIEWADRSKVTSKFAEATIDFIKEAQKAGKPFFVNVWPDDVHSPWSPPADRMGDGSDHQRYLGVLEAMDAQFGPLFDLIRSDSKLRDNTIILVFSDNGSEPAAGSVKPLRGFKGQLYEGGIRSPLVVWGPGFVDPTRDGTANTTSLLCAADLAPTLLKIAGITPPADVHFDGLAVPRVLLGYSRDSRGAPLFFRRPPDRKNFAGDPNLPDLAMRDGRWKLLCDYDGSNPKLYDLDTDIGEKNNLAAKEPDHTREMTRMVVEWNRSLPRAIDDSSNPAVNASPTPDDDVISHTAEGHRVILTD